MTVADLATILFGGTINPVSGGDQETRAKFGRRRKPDQDWQCRVLALRDSQSD